MDDILLSYLLSSLSPQAQLWQMFLFAPVSAFCCQFVVFSICGPLSCWDFTFITIMSISIYVVHKLRCLPGFRELLIYVGLIAITNHVLSQDYWKMRLDFEWAHGSFGCSVDSGSVSCVALHVRTPAYNRYFLSVPFTLYAVLYSITQFAQLLGLLAPRTGHWPVETGIVKKKRETSLNQKLQPNSFYL